VSEELASRFAQDARIDASFDFRGVSQADAEILDRKYMMILMYSCKQYTIMLEAQAAFKVRQGNAGNNRDGGQTKGLVSEIMQQRPDIRAINQYILFCSLYHLHQSQSNSDFKTDPDLITDTIKIIHELSRKRLLRDFYICHPLVKSFFHEIVVSNGSAGLASMLERNIINFYMIGTILSAPFVQ